MICSRHDQQVASIAIDVVRGGWSSGFLVSFRIAHILEVAFAVPQGGARISCLTHAPWGGEI